MTTFWSHMPCIGSPNPFSKTNPICFIATRQSQVKTSRRSVHISARPAFSYDYYLSHPYFVHLIAARTDIVRRVGGLNEAMTISQDVDLVLRLIEVCGVVTHVPDVLYRWRTHAGSLGHQQQDKVYSMTRGALERHFKRMGLKVHFDDRSHFNFRNLRFQHAAQARVAILIPTKNRCDLLHACIKSLERTVDPSLADIIVIDHDSDHPAQWPYLADVGSNYRVVPYIRAVQLLGDHQCQRRGRPGALHSLLVPRQ